MKIRLTFKETFLKNRNFIFFLIGHFISFTGTWIQNVAQNWLVYKLTNSSFYLGFFTFLASSPTIFLGFISGYFIDRFNRRKLLALIVILASIPPLIIGILTQKGIITFWEIAFLAVLMGCFSAMDIPLRQVFISEIVEMRHLTKAISFQSLSFNIARMVGPAIAGMVITNVGLYMCFYLNSLSFLPFFVLLMWFIKPEKTFLNLRSERVKFRQSFKESYVFLKKNRKILFVLLSVACFTFFGISFIVLLPVIVKKMYGGGAKEFSFLSSAIGTGAIFGSLSVIFKRDIKNKPFHLLKASGILSTGIIGLVFNTYWKLLLLFCILIGFSFTNFFPIANSYIQENTPDYLRGRIISFFSFSFLGIYPVGNFLVGILAEKINIKEIAVLYIFLLLCFNTYFFKKINKENEIKY